jgi:hypothetical protein
MKRLAVLSGLVVGAVAAAVDPGDASAERTFRLPSPSGPVFGVHVRSNRYSWREWVAPRSGHCRREGEQVEISTRRMRVTISPPSFGPLAGAYVRTGSPRFVRGTVERECAALTARVRAQQTTRVRWRRQSVVVEPRELITAAEATRRGLFRIRVPVRAYDVELSPRASPRVPLPVYWVGRSFGARRALRTVEHFASYRARRPPEHVFTVLYGRPADAARSSAIPGSGPPPLSELQITSSRASSPNSRRAIEHFQRAHRRYQWPRFAIATSEGERAIVYLNFGEGRRFTNFSVRVGRALVGVAAGRALSVGEARAIASRLRRR